MPNSHEPTNLRLLISTTMSYINPTASSSSTFQRIFNNALRSYEIRTKSAFFLHPLAAQLYACESPSSILVVLQQQARGLKQPQSSDFCRSFELTLTQVCSGTRTCEICALKWIWHTIDRHHWHHRSLGESFQFVSSQMPKPSRRPFNTNMSQLVNHVRRDSQDTLVKIIEQIESFLWNLEIYIKVPLIQG